MSQVTATDQRKSLSPKFWLSSLIVLLVGLAVGFGAGWLANDARDPSCPTEDSCTIDYRDGRWHIEEDVP